MTGGKKKSLVGFLVPIKSTTTTGVDGGGKNPKESTQQVKT